MAVAIADHAFFTVFAGTKENDLIPGCREGDWQKTGAFMAVITERLALAQTAAAPEIGQSL